MTIAAFRRLTATAMLAAVTLTAPAHAGAGAQAGDPAYGEYLSSACVTCHRRDGSDKGIPSIVGWPADQFIAVLKAYKAKMRDNQVMQTVAGSLSEEEMAALAAYYSAIKRN